MNMLNQSMIEFFRKPIRFAPLLIVLVGMNYVVDPAHVFHVGAYESAAARLLLAGSNIDNYDSGGDRLVEQAYLEGSHAPHEIVVMGSSRMMQLSGREFQGRSFFNHSVFGATLQDFVALYSLMKRQGSGPAYLIVGLDPWSFSANVNQERWLPLWDAYATGARQIGLRGSQLRRPWPVAQWSELVSLRYFQESLFLRLRTPLGRPAVVPQATVERDGDTMIRRSDGSVSYPAASRARAPDAVRASAVLTARTSPYMAATFDAPSDSMRQLFAGFLDLLQRDGVSVILWRSPVHPVVYGAYVATDARRRRMDELNEYCARVATAHHIGLVGSFDPEDQRLGDADFLDGLHPRESVMADIARRSAPMAPFGNGR